MFCSNSIGLLFILFCSIFICLLLFILFYSNSIGLIYIVLQYKLYCFAVILLVYYLYCFIVILLVYYLYCFVVILILFIMFCSNSIGLLFIMFCSNSIDLIMFCSNSIDLIMFCSNSIGLLFIMFCSNSIDLLFILFCSNSISLLLYPLSTGGGYTVLPLCPSFQDSFHGIFLSNYWWQKSDIWSQASYRYAILWEAILDTSDSYFLFSDLLGFYTHWTYMRGYHKWALAHSLSWL